MQITINNGDLQAIIDALRCYSRHLGGDTQTIYSATEADRLADALEVVWRHDLDFRIVEDPTP